MDTNSSTLELLQYLHQKGAVWQCAEKAGQILSLLKSRLDENDWWSISIARSHYLNGEGSGELYDTLAKIKAKFQRA